MAIRGRNPIAIFIACLPANHVVSAQARAIQGMKTGDTDRLGGGRDVGGVCCGGAGHPSTANDGPLGEILEIGAVALFGALAAFTATAHRDWSLTAIRFAVDRGLLAIVLISIAIGRPFTMQYARERVGEEYWQHRFFLAIKSGVKEKKQWSWA
jgi:hypothetical protein